jgi:hypothetical protein
MEAALREGAAGALSEARMREIAAEAVKAAMGQMVLNPYASVTERDVPASRLRELFVADQKHGPRAQAISARLRSYIDCRGLTEAKTREYPQPCRPGRILFSIKVADQWHRDEGRAWIKAATDAKRGQLVLKLVPAVLPEANTATTDDGNS